MMVSRGASAAAKEGGKPRGDAHCGPPARTEIRKAGRAPEESGPKGGKENAEVG